MWWQPAAGGGDSNLWPPHYASVEELRGFLANLAGETVPGFQDRDLDLGDGKDS